MMSADIEIRCQVIFAHVDNNDRLINYGSSDIRTLLKYFLHSTNAYPLLESFFYLHALQK